MNQTENQQTVKPILQLRIEREIVFFGPGVAELLQNIDETHSIHSAAKKMNMAYSKAWKMITNTEGQLGTSILNRHYGGSGGGGSELSVEGRTFLNCFLQLEEKLQQECSDYFKTIFSQFL